MSRSVALLGHEPTLDLLPAIAQLLTALCAVIGISIPSLAQTNIQFINQTNQDIYVHFDLHYGSNCTSTGQYIPDAACVPANDVVDVPAPSGVFILYLEVSCACDPISIVEDMDCGEETQVIECGANQYIMGLTPLGWRIEPYTP